MRRSRDIVRRNACWLAAAALLAVGMLPSTRAAGASGAQPLVVFAAASLKNAMDGVAKAYDRRHAGPDVRVSYAGSSTLARQIEAGAPADIYVSADQQWMNKLTKDGRIDRASRYNLLGNTLVLIAPKDSRVHLSLHKHVDLLGKLGAGQYLAMANTDAVPAGIYGRHALQWLGIWSKMKSHVAQAGDVRAALALVSRGESPLGIVYGSDAVADHGVRVVARFPASSHAPIIYPAAATASSRNPQDAAFLAFLKSKRAAHIFKRWGFRVLAASS